MICAAECTVKQSGPVVVQVPQIAHFCTSKIECTSCKYGNGKYLVASTTSFSRQQLQIQLRSQRSPLASARPSDKLLSQWSSRLRFLYFIPQLFALPTSPLLLFSLARPLFEPVSPASLTSDRNPSSNGQAKGDAVLALPDLDNMSWLNAVRLPSRTPTFPSPPPLSFPPHTLDYPESHG